MKRSYSNKLVLLLILIAAILLYFFTPLKEYTSPAKITALVNATGPFGPIVFAAIYYVITLLFFSAAAFSVIAGTLFGNLWGTVIVVIAATLSAQSAFLIARALGAGVIEKLGTHGSSVTKLINYVQTGVKKNGFQFFFIMRCLFVPYIPASYAAGLVTEASAWQFFFATLLTNMIFSPAFVYLGDNLTNGPKALLLPVILIILVLSVPKILKKFTSTATNNK